jgi:dTDP-glucose 4,6-dehydratase
LKDKNITKYLITGGAGFIGSNFIHFLADKYPDARIINLDKLTYAGNLDNLKTIAGSPRYAFVKGDIADKEVVEKLVIDCDVIINFAAETHVDRSIKDPQAFLRTNILGTQVLLDSATRHGKHMHHISTDEVFGSLSLDDGKKFREETPYDPSSPYSASKAASDHLARAYHKTFGTKVTISNCSNNYGPYQFIEKFIPLIITRALEDRPIPVYGSGKNVRDWIFVSDHCEAIDMVVQKGGIGETYLIGGESETDNLSVVKEILKILKKPESLIDFVEDRKGHDLRYAIDNGKIKKELGFAPKHSLKEGLALTVSWYLENSEWWKALQTKEYQNYYQQQYENRTN